MTTQFTPSEDQEILTDESNFSAEVDMGSQFDMSNDMSYSDTSPEDQGFNDFESTKILKEAKKRGDGGSNKIFYDNENTPSEDQTFIEDKKKEYERKKYARKYGKKYDKKYNSNPAEDQYFGEGSDALNDLKAELKFARPGTDRYNSLSRDISILENKYSQREPHRRNLERNVSFDDPDTEPTVDDIETYLRKRGEFGTSPEDQYFGEESDNKLDSLSFYDTTPPEDQYVSTEARRPPRIYKPIERRGRAIDDTYQDILVGETLGQDYDNDTLPYSIDQNIDLTKRNYDFDFSNARSQSIRDDNIRRLRTSLRGNTNTSPEDQYLERDSGYGNRYPVIYKDTSNTMDYPINDTYTDILFGPILGQDYDNDGVPYALENSGYVRADEYEIIDKPGYNNYTNRTPIEDQYLSESSIRPPEIHMSPEYPRGTRINNTYNDIIFNDTLGQDYDDDGVPYVLETDELPEDRYISKSSISPPEIYMSPEYPRGTKIDNTYNDIIFNDTLGQDYDDDGVPYALETRDIMADNYAINFEGGGDTSSERLRELRSSIRDSINSSATPEDQYFAKNENMYDSGNPFDATSTDPSRRPRIYDEKDYSKYPEDDTIADVVFGDTLGQDYDNDGIPYSIDQMEGNYPYDYERDKYMSKEYMMKNRDIMDDNYGSVFEGKSRENAIGNIRRNLGNRFRDSTNDTIASEIARNRLSRRMENTDSAERASERARILADARSVGSGRSMFNGKRSGRGRIDNYVMGDYEPSPAAALAGNYDYEGAILNNGVAARAMREARNY